MSNMFRNILLAAAVSVVAPIAASAATCDVGTCGLIGGADGQVLDSNNDVNFQVFDIENEVGGPNAGTFNFVAWFDNQSAVASTVTTTVLQFKPSNLAGIANLVMTFFNPALGSFAITDANGNGLNLVGNDSVFAVDLSNNQGPINFELQGTALPTSGGLNPSLQLTISAVPVPAAGILLLGALGGLGFAGRRRKKA